MALTEESEPGAGTVQSCCPSRATVTPEKVYWPPLPQPSFPAAHWEPGRPCHGRPAWAPALPTPASGAVPSFTSDRTQPGPKPRGGAGRRPTEAIREARRGR